MSRQMFRSPTAVVVWWIWVLFAVGNLADIAVQGHDHASLVAALVLLAVTGGMYVGAWRPRLIVDEDGLRIINPLREHRVAWAAVAAIDTTDLVRVRCEWETGPGGEPGRKSIYAWAVSSSRRREALAQARAARRARSRSRSPASVFGAADGRPGFPGGAAAPRVPEAGNAESIATVLRARADDARTAAPDTPAARPVSTWSWLAAAVVGAPLVALLAVLAL